VGLAFLLNFLLFAGAGLMYAGQWGFGILYLALGLFFLFVYSPLAIVVAVVSYIHAYVAIENYNTKAKTGSAAAAMPVSSQSATPAALRTESALSSQNMAASGRSQIFCVQCGRRMQSRKNFCTFCGAAIGALNDNTRIYDATDNVK
jgi:TM2 domain-containing membrane protein YozV/ribosomal protein L37E